LPHRRHTARHDDRARNDISCSYALDRIDRVGITPPARDLNNVSIACVLAIAADGRWPEVDVAARPSIRLGGEAGGVRTRIEVEPPE
jgi:hypothetical protein